MTDSASARFLSPIPPDTDLRRRAASSGVIRLVAQAAQVLLGAGSIMALARLLTPGDFGLFAMVGSLVAFIGSFRDFGLPMAATYHQELDQRRMSALFWLNLRLNALLVLFMALMAPVLAWFYGEARLIAMTLVMAVGVFGIGLAVPHESLLTRRMRFGALALIETGALLAGGVAGIGLAALGVGYWALVAQFLAANVARAAAAWLACGWRPGRVPGRSAAPDPGLRPLLTYGRQVTFSRVIAHVGRNLDRVLVGYFNGPSAMGLYDRAYQWSIFPTKVVHGPLLGVTVASLSRVRDDPARYRDYCRHGLLPLFALCLPALAFMAVAARDVLLLLLGRQWLEAVPLFRVLCVAAFVGTMGAVTKPLYLSSGETRRQLRWGLVATPLTALAVAVGSRWGAYGVAVGFAVATCLLTPPGVAFCLRASPLTGRDFLGIVWRPVVASLVATLALAAGDRLLPAPGNVVLALPVKLALFGALYGLFWVALPGGRAVTRDALRLAVELRPGAGARGAGAANR